MRYEVAYQVEHSHAVTTLELKRPFESDAIEALYSRGTVRRDCPHKIIIKSIKPV